MQKTLSRKSDDDVPNKKRRQTFGNETVSFLRERMASGEVIREKELELKQLEFEQAQKARENAHDQQSNMMDVMKRSMDQMQQITSSFMQAQSVQTQALYALLERFSKQ